MIDMVIDECIDRLEEYGYAVSISPWPGRLYIDGYGLRIGLTVNEGNVTEIDCYLRRDDEIDLLLGTTSVYPNYRGLTEMVDGIGMNEMFSVLSEPRKAVMKFRTMKLEKDLRVLEG